MRWQIILGTLSLGAVLLVAGIVALTESQRMEDFTQAYASRQIEIGATLYENNCRSCHGPQGKGSPLAPTINDASIFNGERLLAVGWTGTLEDYLRGVIAAGRPVPSAGTNYPQRMPTWSQRNGGPLRDDQVEALVFFVLNWEARALAEAGEEVGRPVEGLIGTDITVTLPPGDPDAGKALSEGILGCAGCHVLAAVGPLWEGSGDVPGMGERAAQRLQQADYTGNATTPEQYLIESVVQSNAYVVEGYQAGVMPANYGERLTVQEMADLVAYMLSFR